MPDSQWLWMRPWTLAICSAAALLVPYVSTLWLPLILTTITLLLLGVSRCWKSLVPWRPLMLAVAIGCGWGLLQGFSALRAALPMPCEGRDLWLQGLVWDLPQRQPGSYPGSAPDISRWTFRVTAVADRDDEQCLWSGGLIRVYWDDLLPAEPGQHWQIRARLRRPVYPLNPGSSDREAAALHAGIRAIASASVQHARLVNDALSNRVWHQQMRWSLLQRIEASELPQWQRALIRALTIGDRSGLSDTVQDRVRALGLSHPGGFWAAHWHRGDLGMVGW